MPPPLYKKNMCLVEHCTSSFVRSETYPDSHRKSLRIIGYRWPKGITVDSITANMAAACVWRFSDVTFCPVFLGNLAWSPRQHIPVYDVPLVSFDRGVPWLDFIPVRQSVVWASFSIYRLGKDLPVPCKPEKTQNMKILFIFAFLLCISVGKSF